MAGRPKRRARLAAQGTLEPLPYERTHGPGCECRKCSGLRGAVDGVPFDDGNQAAATHYGYSTLGRAERAREIADETRPLLPVYSPADEATLRLFATTMAQLERGVAALERLDAETGNPLAPYLVEDAERLQRLRADVRGWIGTARRLAADLGLSPSSRAKLGLDIAATQRTLSLIEAYRDSEELA